METENANSNLKIDKQANAIENKIDWSLLFIFLFINFIIFIIFYCFINFLLSFLHLDVLKTYYTISIFVAPSCILSILLSLKIFRDNFKNNNNDFHKKINILFFIILLLFIASPFFLVLFPLNEANMSYYLLFHFVVYLIFLKFITFLCFRDKKKKGKLTKVSIVITTLVLCLLFFPYNYSDDSGIHYTKKWTALISYFIDNSMSEIHYKIRNKKTISCIEKCEERGYASTRFPGNHCSYQCRSSN